MVRGIPMDVKPQDRSAGGGQPTKAYDEYAKGEISSSEYFERVRRETDADVRREQRSNGDDPSPST
jgi:hypothetical protein